MEEAETVTLIDPEGNTKGLNTGLGYLAGSLIQNGYNVNVIDLNNRRDNALTRINSALNVSKYIGISIKTFTLRSAVEIIKQIDKKDRILMVGGPHITLNPKKFLEENNKVDYGVIYEGEKTTLELIGGKPINDIKNVVYREDNEIIINENKDYLTNFINDLDSLPFPNYDVFDSLPPDKRIDIYPLVTSRGCPFPCTYCSVGKVIGKIWRARSPQNIIEELFYAKEKYKSTKFEILDDDFTLSVPRAKEICQKMIDEKVNMEWSCPNGIRADRLDEELLDLMKTSGCKSITIGIESLVPEVFDKINKKEKIEQIENAIQLAKKKKIKINGFFIIGLLGSTFELDKKSLDRALKLGLNGALWNILVPYPKTQVYDEVINNPDVKFLSSWEEGFHFGKKPKVVFETKEYNKQERIKMFYLANLRFNNYSIFVDNEDPFYKKVYDIVKIILQYDPYMLPYHATKMFLQKISYLLNEG